LSDTLLTLNMAAITAKDSFDENKENLVAVEKEYFAMKAYLSYNYPQWKIMEYETSDAAEDAMQKGEVDCIVRNSSRVADYLKNKKLSSVFLTKEADVSFAVQQGEPVLLSILNKTLTSMPTTQFLGAVVSYNASARKVTAKDFIQDNLQTVSLIVGISFFVVLCIILDSLKKSKRAEERSKKSAEQALKLNQELEEKQQELQNALVEAQSANKAKTSFLNNMSHDIRTPMNVILGYAQLMEEELKEKELPETKEHLEKLQQSGKLLLSIINNVLDMARIESGKMELDESYGRIEDFRQSVFAVFDAEAKKKKIAFQYTMKVEHEHVLTDVTKVKEIFVNILSNAMKYTPSGGSVMVSLEELPCDEPGYMIVRTRISDTGIGMSQDYLTRIFEAFTREQNTTKSKIAGTGLGMSIVKKYVDLLGGTIQVESELGKGSTFTVTLKHKIADESYYGKGQIENPETGTEILKGRNILIAEDNDLNAEIAAAILERAGLKTERVENGVQCVNLITKMPAGTYDMILMDIQMPEMDGYEAARVIRQLPDRDKACIPIIAMTANAFEEDRKDAMAAGMNGHMAKPIQVDQLLSMLAEMI